MINCFIIGHVAALNTFCPAILIFRKNLAYRIAVGSRFVKADSLKRYRAVLFVLRSIDLVALFVGQPEAELAFLQSPAL